MTAKTKVTYEVVPHDGGWAYRLGDTFSESFATKELATVAAGIAAEEQQHEGATEVIQYQDADGRWRTELADGADRPEAEVEISDPSGDDEIGPEGPSDRLAGSPAEKQGFDAAFLTEALDDDDEPDAEPRQVALADSLRELVRDYPFRIVFAALTVGFFLGRR